MRAPFFGGKDALWQWKGMFSCKCKTSSDTVANWTKPYVVLTRWIYRSNSGMHPFLKYFIDYKLTRKHIYLRCFKYGMPSQYMIHCNLICRKWFSFAESLNCAIFLKWKNLQYRITTYFSPNMEPPFAEKCWLHIILESKCFQVQNVLCNHEKPHQIKG